jgi:hypothetical protein
MIQHYLLEPISKSEMEIVGISNDEVVIKEWRLRYPIFEDLVAIDCDSYDDSVAILKEIGDKW